MDGLKLSILTPAVPSRLDDVNRLSSELARQIGELPVEHIVLLDNKRRTVGEKRDALLRAARGEFVAFVDDDDWVSHDYVPAILNAIAHKPDVVTFRQGVSLTDAGGITQTSTVDFRLGQENGPVVPGGITKRNAWHVCAWRRTVAILSRFPATNYGEDWAFAARLCAIAGLKEIHVPQVLHFYRHSALTTEAPPPISLPDGTG